MKNTMRQIVLAGVCFLAVFFAGCTTVPVTGRSQFNTIPDSLINSMALQEYNAFLKDPKTTLSTDAEKTAMVQQVGTRIADAVERYMNENYMNDRIAGYKWEFNLVESKEKNAWAMPGGKVVVYSGLLEVTQDDAGLAVVIGHEIAHAVAKHGSERMSQALMVTLGGIGLDQAMKDQPDSTRTIFLSCYGVGTSLAVMLPYSRLHENEADQLGLIFMAMAGYDPEAAVGFWERMAASKKEDGVKMPEFLSTHPADQTRIQNIKNFLPEARRYYSPQTGQPAQKPQTEKLGVYGI
ncbi:MAG: M48 family metallopeptidase [Planctomycetales bacterium]|nr:M48 family metallopeptidase [Planctomycetales bacterium]